MTDTTHFEQARAKFKHKKHIFFDLDHTLWHYEANCAKALEQLYHNHQLQGYNVPSAQALYERFFEINSYLWTLYDNYKITSTELRERRFFEIMNHFSPCTQAFCNRLSDEYLDISPKMPTLIPQAKIVLDYLRPKYSLHIITNGFVEIQSTKLRSSGIEHYFETLTCSAEANARKPEPAIFAYAMQKAKAALHDSLMIGDNLDTDIAGAKNAGMDYIHFVPENNNFNFIENSQVKDLLHLKHFL